MGLFQKAGAIAAGPQSRGAGPSQASPELALCLSAAEAGPTRGSSPTRNVAFQRQCLAFSIWAVESTPLGISDHVTKWDSTGDSWGTTVGSLGPCRDQGLLHRLPGTLLFRTPTCLFLLLSAMGSR